MRSMTGYGRGEAVNGDSKFVVELSSVNRKQKEVVVNLPRKLTALETQVRKEILEGHLAGTSDGTGFGGVNPRESWDLGSR